ncbi:LCP family protein [Bacillus marinisedimentorum]|uniref:LCP family glycopolymer transferase n=1 Tax=Bacillus marinisedimentorum TaxID=1821260 RepID=UPI0007E1FDFF|nr:LCP family protein [Bacillus marinisedimentorum]
MRREIRKEKKKRGFKLLLGVLGILLLIGAGSVFYVYNNVQGTVAGMHQEINRNQPEKREKPVDMNKKDPISILLLGVDERESDSGRSDTMVVLTLNPQKESMYMFNIQRDTRTEIIGKGFEDKINHAYAFGGPRMSVETVENFLDIPIDYFVKVNMEAFSDLVDAVGGITVNNKVDWPGYPAGAITLQSGQEALGYVRMRKQDPRGDFGRNERQRQVIQAIIKEGASASSVMKFDEILDVLGTNVKTNMTLDDMNSIRKNYAGARNNIQQFEIKGKGTMIDGIYYQLVSEEERLAVSERLKEHLEIK